MNIDVVSVFIDYTKWSKKPNRNAEQQSVDCLQTLQEYAGPIF